MDINSLVVDVTYASNIGEIIRTSHVLNGGQLYFYDPRGILKKSVEEIKQFSCDLSNLKTYTVVKDIKKFLLKYPGRKIATVISPQATFLPDFQFKGGDLVLFGNERVGLSSEVLGLCDHSVIVPMLGKPYTKTDYHPGKPIKGVGKYPTFKVSIVHGLVMYTALGKLGKFKNFQFGYWDLKL